MFNIIQIELSSGDKHVATLNNYCWEELLYFIFNANSFVTALKSYWVDTTFCSGGQLPETRGNNLDRVQN